MKRKVKKRKTAVLAETRIDNLFFNLMGERYKKDPLR